MVFEVLDDEVASDRAKYQYLSDVKQWYDFVQEKGRTDYNPVASISRRFDWEHESTDREALPERHVRQLYRATDVIEERLIIAALCGWGLRTAEVAALNGESVLQFPPNQEKEQISACLEKIREQNPFARILLVLDNFSSHNSDVSVPSSTR